MTSSQPARVPDQAGQHARTPWTSLVIGVPLAAALLGLIHWGPLRDTTARRYVSHPVECVEVLMFCCAVVTLGGKLWRNQGERRACRTEMLPTWNGRPVPIAEAAQLLGVLKRLP